ncbi:hypothetical protein GMRT_12297 [Giardia muris]|uniref:Uncharacterized protein n=1 Tax=Giardia muris TaxID=5742 RepID=A0A4Z1SXX4_GIAMU|nr:hypothetical protein GMRT_12297 [Giardia muris]|eukprot:TNJ30546.1 hypothetical protein GMRT_12297 [Giardia muris]
MAFNLPIPIPLHTVIPHANPQAPGRPILALDLLRGPDSLHLKWISEQSGCHCRIVGCNLATGGGSNPEIEVSHGTEKEMQRARELSTALLNDFIALVEKILKTTEDDAEDQAFVDWYVEQDPTSIREAVIEALKEQLLGEEER